MSHRKMDGGGTWPCPDEAMGQLIWRLVHMPERVTDNDQAMAATIICAYRHLIALPRSDREDVVRELRRGPNILQASPSASETKPLPPEDYRQGWMDGANEAAHLLAPDMCACGPVCQDEGPPTCRYSNGVKA